MKGTAVLAKSLHATLRPLLLERGFKRLRRLNKYRRGHPLGEASCELQLARYAGKLQVCLGFALRVEEVERLSLELVPDHFPDHSIKTFTVGIEYGHLLGGHRHRWVVTSESEIEAAVPEMLQALDSTGEAFYEQHDSYGALRRTLLVGDRVAGLLSPIHDKRARSMVLLAYLDAGAEAAREAARREKTLLESRKEWHRERFAEFMEAFEEYVATDE